MTARFRVAVCENVAELSPGTPEWVRLCSLVSSCSPHLFLLNEMAFGQWVAGKADFDQDAWRRSCELHQQGMDQLNALGSTVVAGSRPIEHQGRRLNEAFLHTGRGISAVHAKQYFPNEPGYYEANWFQRGVDSFEVRNAQQIRVGFLICTEVMFNEHARRYGRAGAHVILVPRAVGPLTLDRWLVAIRMAAIVSGSYVLSSNRAGTDSHGQVFGGRGWIVSPSGDLVAQTSRELPVAFHDIDLSLVEQAQRQYPCYVPELMAETTTAPPS